MGNKQKTLVSLLGALSLLLITPCFAGDIYHVFTSDAKKVQTDWQVPGMAIAIVVKGKIVYAKGFGERDAKGDSVTPETMFDIASLTKSFTSALIARQVDEGKYSWDTKITTLYPAFKLYDAQATQAFEVRDLIAHDSGLPEDALDAMGDFGYSTDDSINALRFIKPVAPFRTTFAYQDIFLEFAKNIIESSSNETYVSNLHQYLFTPLGMKHTYVRTELAKLNQMNNRAQPFLYYQGKNYPYARNAPYLSQMWVLSPGVAGGGIQSSVIDMAKWLIFNMNEGKLEHKQLISVNNMNFIHSPQTVIKKYPDGEIEQAYGEGWFIDNEIYKPYTLLYHMGGGTGMHALMAYIPQKKVGIVILTNQYTNQVPEILSRQFFDLYLNKKPLKDWNSIYLKERAAEAVNEKAVSNECAPNKPVELTKFIGVYVNPVYGRLTILKQGQQLWLNIGPEHIAWKLSACQDNVLRAYWPNPNGMDVPMLSGQQDLIFFKEGPNGKINTMTVPYLNDDGSGVFIKQ